jgi:hypothetical protein
MNFGLDISVSKGDESISLAELAKNGELAKQVLSKPDAIDGAVVPLANGKPAMQPHFDPLLPLLEQWMLKVPWLLQGDTETVFLRNSEHAFGFEVVNESVQISFFVGQGNEVDEYVMEPVPVPLEPFCDASIGAVKTLLGLLNKVDPALQTTAADVRSLKEATNEAEKALKEYRLQR